MSGSGAHPVTMIATIIRDRAMRGRSLAMGREYAELIPTKGSYTGTGNYDPVTGLPTISDHEALAPRDQAVMTCAVPGAAFGPISSAMRLASSMSVATISDSGTVLMT